MSENGPTFYHRTWRQTAEAVLKGGFRDGRGHYLTDREHVGVWISDRPLDANEGANGDTLLALAIDEDLRARLSEFEWVQEGFNYREWLIPANLLNSHTRVTIEEE